MGDLVKVSRLGPGRKFRDHIELAQQLANQLAGVLALAKLLHLLNDARQRVFGLRDGHLGVVLALPFKTLMMLSKLFAEKLSQTLASGTGQGGWVTRDVDGRRTTLQGHHAG